MCCTNKQTRRHCSMTLTVWEWFPPEERKQHAEVEVEGGAVRWEGFP